jgi:enoyl-CoA hydratase/carnithine racemase
MTPEPKEIVVQRRGSAVWITLNRPNQLNAITPTMANELLSVFDSLVADYSARVVVLRGSGRGFCAGLDIKIALQRQEDANQEAMPLPEIIRAMRRCPQPIIALVHGAACGGGFAFALAADVRIAGESARMNDAFVNLGVSGCELGVSYFLPRQVGLSVAAELMYTGRFLDSHRAREVGLVSEVVPDDALEGAGAQLVEDMLRVAPLALRKTKETLGRVLGIADLDEVLEIEQATQIECIQAGNFEEELRSFVEHRPRVQ